MIISSILVFSFEALLALMDEAYMGSIISIIFGVCRLLGLSKCWMGLCGGVLMTFAASYMSQRCTSKCSFTDCIFAYGGCCD